MSQLRHKPTTVSARSTVPEAFRQECPQEQSNPIRQDRIGRSHRAVPPGTVTECCKAPQPHEGASGHPSASSRTEELHQQSPPRHQTHTATHAGLLPERSHGAGVGCGDLPQGNLCTSCGYVPSDTPVSVGRPVAIPRLFKRLQGWQSVAQAKGLHSAVEKRTLYCTMKRDCARHERRRRKRRGRGRAHRHWALFSCTLLRLQNYRFTSTHNRACQS